MSVHCVTRVFHTFCVRMFIYITLELPALRHYTFLCRHIVYYIGFQKHFLLDDPKENL